MELEVGDIVMCTVDKIVGTMVFVKIPLNGIEAEGSIILSEVAPGRIRNIRDYVVPKKKIVCKVLRISGGRIDLSLRRVTQKEQKEIKEQHNQEKSYVSILRTILGEKADEIIKEITKEMRIYDFVQEIKTNPKKLEDIVGKEASKKIIDILNSQKKKKIKLKREITLTSNESNGLESIKKILEKRDVEIKYLSAGRYVLEIESNDPKSADNKLRKIISDIEKDAKKENIKFDVS